MADGPYFEKSKRCNISAS